MNFLLKHQLVRYLLVGVCNTFFGLGIIFLLKWQFQAGDVLANAVGYACGFVLSYFLNGKFTFQSQQRSPAAFLRFMLVVLVSYAANLGAVMLAIHQLHINSYPAQALGTGFYTAISYLGCKYFVFTAGRPPQRQGRFS